MKYNKYLLLSIFLLFSCNNSSTNSNESLFISDESSSSSETINSLSSSSEEYSQLDLVKKIKNELLLFDDTVSSCTYSVDQVDYYGISIESHEEGTKNLYNDNFLSNDFTQKISDDSFSGKKEYGITGSVIKGYKIYEIVYYGQDDKNNKVNYYDKSDASIAYYFDIGFVNDYINNILDLTILYFENSTSKLSLITNFADLDLSSDGEKTLNYRFTSYAANGININEKCDRDDVIVIENGKIVSCKTTMRYDIQDSTNYKYMEKESHYYYEALSDYNGDKLNPKDYE